MATIVEVMIIITEIIKIKINLLDVSFLFTRVFINNSPIGPII